MSQYSETMGSFIRTGDYPLEADYIFNSVDELKEYCKNNQDVLHKGLLKVVLDEKTQRKIVLYIIADLGNDCLEPKELISGSSLDDIYETFAGYTPWLFSLDEDVTLLKKRMDSLDWHEG